MIVNRSAPPGPVVPRLVYRDVGAALDWLQRAFGFKERLRTLAEPDGSIHHAQLAIGEGSVILTSQPTSAKATSPDQHVVAHQFVQSLHIPVPDVDRHFEHAKQSGARTLNSPESYPFGERQYTAEDLEGNCWTFSQPVANVSPEEWGAVTADIKSRTAMFPRPRWCYLEIPAANLPRSIAFYEETFGWNIRGRDGAHPTFDDAAGYISGAWISGREINRTPGFLPYIWVDSIDATLASVAIHGGAVLKAPELDSPGGEWIATFRDPAGNLIGLYQEGSRSEDLSESTVAKEKLTVAPLLSVRNGLQAIDFYKAAFGACEMSRIQDDSGSVVAHFSIGKSEFWLADESPEHGNFSPESLGGSSVRMVIVAENPDAAFERAVSAGSKIVIPVEDQPYGWRVGRVVDPFGHHWEIGKPLH